MTKSKKGAVKTPIKPNKYNTVAPLVLDLGCGQSKIGVEQVAVQLQIQTAKVTGVDFVPGGGIDVIHDLTVFPYPFKDGSVDGVFSSHFLEHLDGIQRAKFFDEMWRILKPGGKMRFVHPYYKSVRAVQDFTHKFPPISEESYWYWTKAFREGNKLTHGFYDLKCDFVIAAMNYTFMDQTWINKSEEARVFAIRHYFNVVADMIVDMIKPGE